jgi:CheY-like chemotaxis protein
MHTPKILIVDDDGSSRKMLRLILARDRVEVWEASSTEEALKVLETQAAPDLALVDLHLDAASGVDLLRQLRSDCIFGSLPVLFYSATPERDAVVEAMRLGTHGFLAKPVDPNRLRILVNKAQADDWMRVHFETADTVFRRSGIDREKHRELARTFFDQLATIVAHDLESKTEHMAVLPQLAALRRTAGELGLLTLKAGLEQWEAGSPDFHAPALLARYSALRRLFVAFTA